MARKPVIKKERTPEEILQAMQQAYRETFGSEAGHIVLDDLRKSFSRRSSADVIENPYKTAFYEGQRDVYLRIMALLDPELVDPEEIDPEEIPA